MEVVGSIEVLQCFVGCTFGRNTPGSHELFTAACTVFVVAVTTKLNLATLARVGAALADGTRRAVLVELVEGPKYPARLSETLGVSRSGLSNHLACLRGCGLVAATYEGRKVRYELVDPAIAEALTALSQLPLGPCPEDD